MSKAIPDRLVVPLQLAVVVLVSAAAVGTSCSDDVTRPVADAGRASGGGGSASSSRSSNSSVGHGGSGGIVVGSTVASSSDVGEGG